MDWTRVCLFGLLVHVATAEVSWVEADFEEIPHDRVLRSRRNAISKCGTDYIFDYSGATNGTNRTRLAYLMRQINIGNDDGKNKYLSCNKVRYFSFLLFLILLEEPTVSPAFSTQRMNIHIF